MKSVFHKIASVGMAFVVLLSTMSFTFDMHYCGDTLMDVGIFQKAKSCGMDTQDAATRDCSVTEKKCCSDKQLTIDGQDQLEKSIDGLSLEEQVFIVSLISSYLNLFEGTNTEVNLFRDDGTLSVVRNIYKLNESYLI